MQKQATTLGIASPRFSDGGPIPDRYTCQGVNVSPELRFSSAPPGTQSLALLVEDPDAPTGNFVHWVLYQIPPNATGIPEGGPLPPGAKEGINDFDHLGYAGPCPPRGKAHRYYFRLYALDTSLNHLVEPTRDQLLEAMHDHILAKSEVMGTYRRT